MSKLNFAMFMAGASVGAAAAWLYLKKHYEQIAQEEIDSVKAAFAERKDDFTFKTDMDEQEDKQHKADIAKLKPDLVNYATKLQKEGYTNYTEHSNTNIEKEKEDSMPNDTSYVISPEEFGEFDNYTQINLTYYSDGTLADDEGGIMEDIEGTVREDFAEHFGDYEEDSVHIRNDRLRCDYEILKDNRTYDEVAGTRF